MNSIVVLLILLMYLGVLFFTAWWAEKKASSRWTNNAYVYSLSLAVYCTAWTYYGSVGVAADSGLNYLTVYLGPIIAIPAWIVILRKVIRITKVNKISSIADFISLRYGNNRALGAVVTLLCISGVLPYISLQLKAISETFHVITKTGVTSNIFEDTSTYVAISLALFASYYGTRYVDASEKRRGIVTAVALESVLKLLFFIIAGIYVTYFVFDGFDDIYAQASVLPNFKERNTIGGLSQGLNWFFLCMLSLFAIFLLPRQFHTAVVENNRESHLKKAIWLFPLYLLLFNIFVYPIAWGGNILFQGQEHNSDTYSLLIPQHFGNNTMTLLVFLGGFSAAISMVIVSSVSLSIMLSNNVLIPYGFLGSFLNEKEKTNTWRIVFIRKIAIFSLIIISYIIYREYILESSLFSIGLVSFVIIAQLAPSFFGALFWKRGSSEGAIIGIGIGFILCAYTLLIPYFIVDGEYIDHGIFGIELLKPYQLFGLDYLDIVPHALFWSLFFNLFAYMIVSISFKGDYRERNYAEMFVDIEKYITLHENAFVWRGTAYINDIQNILFRFLGKEKTMEAIATFNEKYNIPLENQLADSRLIKYAENLLTGHIGTASAKILISNVVKEEKISLPELLKILEESKENIVINKKLTETSKELQLITQQLKTANMDLLKKDKQKDDFLDTISHELRTPITAIRASTEILYEDDDVPEEMRKQFLKNIISESDRLNRLITKILDLEKFDSGQQKIDLTENNIYSSISESLVNLKQLIENKNIKVEIVSEKNIFKAYYDEDHITQVLHNLLSNAIKFCPVTDGLITISIIETPLIIEVGVEDNGKGIAEEDFEAIFDKFYQSQHQNIQKPVGSGLGLAICKKIIRHHNGEIWAENRPDSGAKITFSLPKNIKRL